MAGHTDNRIEIAASPQVTFSVANDLGRWVQLFAGEYASVEILDELHDRVRFRLTTEPRDGQVRSWVSERCPDMARGTVTARRIETGPFRYMHIFQSVTPLEGNRSELRWVQDFEVRPEAPFTDAQMCARIDEKSAANLRRHKVVIEEEAVRRGRTPAEPAGDRHG